MTDKERIEKLEKENEIMKKILKQNERRKSMSRQFEQAKACVDGTVKSWNRTTLTDIEKYGIEYHQINGMVKLALYILNFDEYNAFKQYIYDKYGFNVGGVVTNELVWKGQDQHRQHQQKKQNSRKE